MDVGYAVGIAGSVASLVTLFVSAPTWRSRVVHAIYVLIVTVLAGAYVAAQSRLEQYSKLERETRAVIATCRFLE